MTTSTHSALVHRTVRISAQNAWLGPSTNKKDTVRNYVLAVYRVSSADGSHKDVVISHSLKLLTNYESKFSSSCLSILTEILASVPTVSLCLLFQPATQTPRGALLLLYIDRERSSRWFCGSADDRAFLLVPRRAHADPLGSRPYDGKAARLQV